MQPAASPQVTAASSGANHAYKFAHGLPKNAAIVSIASPDPSPLTTPSSSPGCGPPGNEEDWILPPANLSAASKDGAASSVLQPTDPSPLIQGAATACPWCNRTSPHQCIKAASVAALKVFSAAYGLKAVISLLFTLLKRRFTAKAVGAALLSADSLRFGAFLGSLCGLVRAIRCSLARYRGVDDKWNAALSGALSSVSIALDSPQRQWAIASYMACRAMYSFTHTAMRIGALPRIPHFNRLLYGISAAGILYAFLFEPRLLDETYYAWMTRICNVPNSTLQWVMRDNHPSTLQHLLKHESVPLIQGRLPHNCTFPTVSSEVVQHLKPILEPSGREYPSVTTDTSASLLRIANATFGKPLTQQDPVATRTTEVSAVEALQPYRNLYSGPRTLHAALVNSSQHPYAYRRCDCMWHPGQTCAAAHLGEFPAIVARCLRVYLPVHLLPFVLFKTKHLAETPVAALQHLGASILKSTAFLSTSISTIKILLCALRTTYRDDKWWFGPVAGFLSAGGLFFETHHRVSELMLYCMPKFLYIVYALLERKGWVVPIPGSNVLIFAAAMSALLLVDRQDYSSSHATLLKFLFGDDSTSIAVAGARMARGVPLENLMEQAAGVEGLEVSLEQAT